MEYCLLYYTVVGLASRIFFAVFLLKGEAAVSEGDFLETGLVFWGCDDGLEAGVVRVFAEYRRVRVSFSGHRRRYITRCFG